MLKGSLLPTPLLTWSSPLWLLGSSSLRSLRDYWLLALLSPLWLLWSHHRLVRGLCKAGLVLTEVKFCLIYEETIRIFITILASIIKLIIVILIVHVIDR